MITIGFIDDDNSYFDDYNDKLEYDEIEMLFVEGCKTEKDVLNWILNNQIKCMLIDYKLNRVYDFNGTDLVTFINSEIPDLPCIILTNYCDEGIAENLVTKNIFIERELFSKDLNSQEFRDLVFQFKQATEVFENRISRHLSEYENLKQKKDNKLISHDEEERFINLYRILKAYGEVDDLPLELLSTAASRKMDDILGKLDKLLGETE